MTSAQAVESVMNIETRLAKAAFQVELRNPADNYNKEKHRGTEQRNIRYSDGILG